MFRINLQYDGDELEFKVFYEDLGDSTIRSVGFNPVPDRWYHLAFTVDKRDEGILSMFINGQKLVSGNSSLSGSGSGSFLGEVSSISTPLYAGIYIDVGAPSDTSYFNGIIDDIRVFGNALTDNQILDVYNDVNVECTTCGEATFPAMAGFWKFDECDWNGSPYEIKDATLNYQHGSSRGGMWSQSAISKFCYAPMFDGTNDFIIIPHNSIFNAERSLSISCWLYKDAGVTGDRTIVSKQSDTTGFRLSEVNGTLHWETNSHDWDTEYVLPEEQWTHVITTFSMDPIRKVLFVNGSPDTAISAFTHSSLDSNQTDLFIGAGLGSSSDTLEYWDGYMDNVRVFLTALSSDQAADIYNESEGYCAACEGDTIYSASTLPSDNWRLIGVPAIPENGNPLYVIGDDMDGKVPSDLDYTWNMIAFDSRDSVYSYYSSDTSAFPHMIPGRGYIASQSFGTDKSISMRGVSVISPYSWQLESPSPSHPVSYNLLANPFESMVRWSNVRFSQGLDTMAVGDAADAGWINSYAYIWDYQNSVYYPIDPEIDSWYDRDTISVWEGYWALVYSSTPTKILYDRERFGKISSDIPSYISSTGDVVREYSRTEALSVYNEWLGLLSVKSADGVYRSLNNRFGIDRKTTNGADARDAVYFLPAAEKFVSVYFDSPAPYNLVYDFRSPGWSVLEWPFRIWNRGIDAENYSVSIPNFTSLPGNIRLTLLDENGDLLKSLSASDPDLSVTVPKNSIGSFILKAEAVKDSAAADMRAVLHPVVLDDGKMDLYLFPGEKLDKLSIGVDGSTRTVAPVDRLYNLYRTRIGIPENGALSLDLFAEDMNGNVLRRNLSFTLGSFAKNSSGVLEYFGSDAQVLVGNAAAEYHLAVTKFKNSGGEDIYSLQPFGLDFSGDVSLVFHTGLTGDSYEHWNNVAVYRETESGNEPLAATVDPENGTISIQLESSGNYFLGRSAEGVSVTPEKTQLYPNYPNPFNASTTIRYSLSEPGRAVVTVYDLRGALVRSWSTDRQAGLYDIRWNGDNEYGKSVSTGIYFVTLETGTVRSVRKMLLIK